MAKLYAIKSRNDYWFRNVQALVKGVVSGNVDRLFHALGSVLYLSCWPDILSLFLNSILTCRCWKVLKSWTTASCLGFIT